ncbi:MAG: hypothetical protein ABI419_06335 [Ginsengibacter sp.]
MKKIMAMLLVTGLLSACNSQNHEENNTASEATTETNHEHAEKATVLVLNNGAKWKADSVTNHNVVRLKTTADMFRVEPFPSIDNYQVLGNDLSNDVDTLIQQCKMKGDEHEALHKWLEPILNLTTQLKNTTDTAKARQIFKSADTRIDEYRNFFE